MKKFNIKPYVHEVVVKLIYMSGKQYGPEILKINEEVIKERVLAGIRNIAQFSLSTNIPTKASAAHTVMSALGNLLGLKGFTGVDVACLKGGAGGAVASAPVVAEVKEDKKDDKKGGKDAKDDKKWGKDDKKGKKAEPEPVAEEEDMGGMGDLFG